MQKKIATFLLVAGFILGLLSVQVFSPPHMMTTESYIAGMTQFRENLIMKHKYKCCLDKSCTYCLKKEEGCTCMDKLMAGKHPCGECIGEILEGHGNKFLTKYFASAIAEKVGMQHLDELKQIIAEKYNMGA